MKLTDKERPPQKPEGAPKRSAEPVTSLKEHSVSRIAMMAQHRSREIDTCGQKGGYEALDDDEFVTMSETLPEMNIIFENEYTM